MKTTFHQLVQKDVWAITQHYEEVSGEKLADEFYEEFISFAHHATRHPERFHFDRAGLRRANLERFPYHFLYRARRDDIFILVLRHHHRSPSYGLNRKG